MKKDNTVRASSIHERTSKTTAPADEIKGNKTIQQNKSGSRRRTKLMMIFVIIIHGSCSTVTTVA